MENKYVPTPWAVANKVKRYGTPLIEINSNHVENGIPFSLAGAIAYVVGHHEEAEATAAHIVKCVNAHDELVEALKATNRYFVDLQNKCKLTTHDETAWKKVAGALKKVTDTTPIEKQPK